jgi:hypothetical protein
VPTIERNYGDVSVVWVSALFTVFVYCVDLRLLQRKLHQSLSKFRTHAADSIFLPHVDKH